MLPSSEESIVWSDVAEATFVIRQRFRYDYPGPIADLHHRLTIMPRERHGDQNRIASRLDCSPPATSGDERDQFGNPVATFFARRVARSIEFTHFSIVTRSANQEHRIPGIVLDDDTFLRPTSLTACDADLRAAGRILRAEHADAYELAHAINAFVFAHMTYSAGTTNVETPAATAFSLRAGVCQDYAHIMLALCRYAGLHARYVSGHMIGEGGTHAWVEVLLPAGTQAIVLSYDPTHGRRVDMRYVVVAVGRDYADVAPTSGVFTAPYQGELTASKSVVATRVKYLDPARAVSLPAAAAS